MQTIGRYQLVEKLGQGGMGIVYRAFDSLIERVVAIKVISSPVDLNPEMRERFFREARAAGQLSHKNIITIHDLGEHEGQPYLAMEYLEGEDLQKRLHGPEKISLSRKLDLAIEICEGLEYAHSRGVIHRDIKPANIFITDRGTVKILDFGLARLLTSQLTNTNMLMGTLNYMAPEQVRGERADQRSDVFSIGVVLYELLCGKKAFEGDSFASTLYKILQEVPEPLWKIDATLPRELVAIVERALAKPKDERYQQMSELRADLAAYRHQMHGGEAEPTSPISRPSSDARHVGQLSSADPTQAMTPVPAVGPGSGAGTAPIPVPRREFRLSLAIRIAFLVVVAAAAGIWFANRQRNAAPPPDAARTSTVTPPDPTAEPLRRAQQALQSGDYQAAQRNAQVVLTQNPQHQEAQRIHDAARDAALAAALQQARAHLAASEFSEASRAAGAALTLAPDNAEAKRLMEQVSASARGRGADEARLRMVEARSAAQAAGAPKLASSAYRTAARVEQDGQRLYKAGHLAEATTRFYEASGLYRSAETTARTQAAAAAAPAPLPAPPAAERAPERPPETAKPATQPEPTPAATPPPPLPKPPDPAASAPSIPPSSVVKNPTPPASTPPSPELTPRSPTAEDRVGELVTRYKAALESRSLDELRRIWPTLSGAAQEAIRNEFQHASRIAVDLVEPHVQISGPGTSGTVTFLRRYDLVTVEGQRLHSEARTVMEVRRTASGAWVIDSIRFTPVR